LNIQAQIKVKNDANNKEQVASAFFLYGIIK
jgi:hypothetical protein